MMLNANLGEQDREEDKEVISEDAKENLDAQKNINRVSKETDMQEEEEELKAGSECKEDWSDAKDGELKNEVKVSSYRLNTAHLKDAEDAYNTEERISPDSISAANEDQIEDSTKSAGNYIEEN